MVAGLLAASLGGRNVSRVSHLSAVPKGERRAISFQIGRDTTLSIFHITHIFYNLLLMCSSLSSSVRVSFFSLLLLFLLLLDATFCGGATVELERV